MDGPVDGPDGPFAILASENDQKVDGPDEFHLVFFFFFVFQETQKKRKIPHGLMTDVFESHIINE